MQYTLNDVPIDLFKKTRKKLYTVKAVCVDMGRPMTRELKQLLTDGKKKGAGYRVNTVNIVPNESILDVMNYFEGSVYSICEPNMGASINPDTVILLKGTVDELWGVPLKKVLTQYTKADGSMLTPVDFRGNNVVTIQSKPSNLCYAAFINKNTQVIVQTAWGDVLTANRQGVPHGKGDFLVCNAGPDGLPALQDTWVVNGTVFPSTYDMRSFPNMVSNNGAKVRR